MRRLLEVANDKAGHNVNFSDANGTTPLIAATASSTESLEKVKLLVEHKADLNYHDSNGYSAATVAGYLNKLDVLEYLMTHESYRDPPHHPLFGAVTNSLKAVEFIVERRRADPNMTVPPKNQTPLYFAIKFGQPEIVRFLLRRGARTTGLDSDNTSAESMLLPEGERKLREEDPSRAVDPKVLDEIRAILRDHEAAKNSRSKCRMCSWFGSSN